ncbi:MAG: hypothetical protein QXO84_03950 [Candidatus Aenigmatarchaeota archaeon]
MLLIFCSACGSIMTLKEKKEKMGIYRCTRCNMIKKVKVALIEKKEAIKYVAPPVPL